MSGAAEARQPVGGAAIDLERVGMVFPSRRGPVRVLRDVSFSVRAAEFIALLGPSGCGKSTLLNVVAGLLRATAGAVRIDGAPVTRPYTRAGMVFQRPVLLDWRTALQNVLLAAEAHHLPRAAAQARASELLTSVGLADFAHAYPRELSGGMQQRVAICRALLHDPPLLLMDEPFAALDALTRDQMAVDLQRLWLAQQPTVLFVTHSIPEAVFLADRVIVLTSRPGQIDRVCEIDLGRPRTLRTRQTPAFAAYVQQLLDLFVATGLLVEQ